MAARVIIGLSSINLTDISQDQATVILSYESSQALYSHLNLHMIAFIDTNSKNQWFYNTTTTSDQYTSNFYKNKVDTSNLSDDEYLLFGKGLADIPKLSDSFYRVVQYRRSFLDNANLLDNYDNSFFKALTDQSNLSDTKKLDTTKLLLNKANIPDLYESSFTKARGDSFSLQDTIDTIGFFKNVENSVGFSEVETRAFAKYLFDTVSLTDDVDGAASVLDDQEMEYFKFVNKIAKATDTFYRVVSFVREYVDTSTISENSVFDYNKYLEDSSNISDTFYRMVSFVRGYEDSSTMSEDSVFDYNKNINQATEATDTFHRMVSFIRGYENTSILSEDSTFNYNKALQESSSISDDNTFDFSKAIEKTTSVSESLAIELLLAPFVDASTIADEFSKGIGLLPVTTTSLSDTGSLRSQGYSDFSYFEEDYVGSSRIF